MSPRKKMVYLLMVGLIIKHLLFGEYGAFDRFLEFLVVAMILYDLIHNACKERREKQRQQFLEDKTQLILGLINNGRAILSNIPTQAHQGAIDDSASPIVQWMSNVDSWMSETQKFLDDLSAKVSTAFTHFFITTPHNSNITLPNGTSMYVSSWQVVSKYEMLASRLANLDKIMGNPGAYF